MQQFDGAGSDARIELEADQLMRNAVAVFVDLDLIVDVNRQPVKIKRDSCSQRTLFALSRFGRQRLWGCKLEAQICWKFF
ncbi:MAG: hypothetical protein RXR20_00030 [Paraburkholderia sp.]|jgi:hypothetical protein|uniref:hypothetical protein n=1 Tax=Paraburkholderia ferrariae TaxID=386056 RepID=UPI000485AF2B|nr:hypothetical protein [Paraburkholderia ferrariae]